MKGRLRETFSSGAARPTGEGHVRLASDMPPVACAPDSDRGAVGGPRPVVGAALVLAISTVVFFAGFASAQTGGGYDLTWNTVDGGGETFSTGGEFELSGTIGQPDAGVMEGGEFTLAGGFWFEEPPGDCNSTGGVDLLDHDDFEPCLSGPNTGVSEGCECFDVNRSGTVDLFDFAVAQTSFTGS